MEIKFSPHLSPLRAQTYGKNISSYHFSGENNDSFVKTGKNISFGKNIFSYLKKIKNNDIDDSDEIPSEYATDLSYGIKKVFNKDIPAKNLTKIMTPEEFREVIKNFQKENFVASKKNIDAGIYCADLDYQSNYSTGKESIFDILDKAATYAQQYYKTTGKDFIFAIADRDSLEGLQHAIRIFGENPGKYKHMKLLPGVKLSFAHEAPTSIIGYENSEMLIYGLNPYSDNVISYVEDTIKRRKEMTINFIRDVNTLYPEFAYNIIEFAEQNNLKYIKDYTVSNLYWRAREYAETKGDTAIKGISIVPEEVIKQAENILDNLSTVYLGSGESTYSALGSNIIKDSDVNKTIKKVFEKYSTHMDESQGKVVSTAENLYDDMISCFSKESEKPVMAIASPYYFSHYFEKKDENNNYKNVVAFFKELQDRSNGMLKGFESIVPNYENDKQLKTETIVNFNNVIRENTDLCEVGGSLQTFQN